MTTEERETHVTDNLPALVPSEPRGIIAAPADTDSWTEVVGEVAKLAAYVADTDFVPRALRGSAAATTAAILYGREVGLPPMTALNGVHMIEGSPSLSSEQMRALVFAAGHELEFTTSTGATCIVRGRRRGSETWHPVEWTIDMARAAGLLAKKGSVWSQYPRRMLQARATSELCELVFPDVIHGFRSLEVMRDQAAEDGAAEVAARPRSTSRVARKPATPEPAAPAAAPEPATPAAAPERPQSAPARHTRPGVPLPGEAGYGDARPGTGPVAHPAAGSRAGSTPVPATSTSPGATSTPSPGDVPAAGEAERIPPAAQDDGPEPRTQAEEDLAPDETRDVVEAEVIGETPPARIDAIRPAQRRMILAKLGSLGINGTGSRAERLRLVGYLIGRELDTFDSLSKSDASTVIDALALCNSLDQLVTVAEETHAAESEQVDAELWPPSDPEETP